jgi:alpha-tubulin suppressor-like RCC1 family protein
MRSLKSCLRLHIAGHRELGQGHTSHLYTPTTISALALDEVAMVASGAYHNFAVLKDGSVKGWGYNDHGELGLGHTLHPRDPEMVVALGTNVAQMFPSHHSSYALLKDGSVMAMGQNSYGQLGFGHTSHTYTPRLIPALQSNVQTLAYGSQAYNMFALLKNGTVMAWGHNHHSILGLGDTTNRYTPVPVDGLGPNVQALFNGYHHTFALFKDGSVKGWGYNGQGQLGLGDTTARTRPAEIPGLSTDVVFISVGEHHTCVVLKDDSFRCAGHNNHGQVSLPADSFWDVPL